VRRSPAELADQLRKTIGTENVLTDPERVLPYASDAMPVHREQPAMVIRPEQLERAIETVRLLHEAEIPWTPRGAGTGLSGGAVASPEGAVVSLARLRRILHVDPAAGRARVEPGVVNLTLNRELKRYGLQFAPDPASQVTSTIGGNIAENAGGPHTLKYGVTSRHVLGLHLLLGDGTIIRLGGEEETIAGYDLVGLCVGSEGTFGLIGEATLRLVPLPEATRAFVALFSSTADASRAVAALLRSGVVPAALEMLDCALVKIFREISGIEIPPATGAMLMADLDGLEDSLAEQMARAKEAVLSAGPLEFRVAPAGATREALWRSRMQTFGALGRLAPNYISHDVVIPRTALPGVLERIGRLSTSDLPIGHAFHAGDGNLHPTIFFDQSNPSQAKRAEETGRKIIRICLDAGGALTGEHGIGLSKREAMRCAFTGEDIALMHRLRRAFDPWDRVNPGKVLPPLEEEGDREEVDADGIGRPRAARREVSSSRVSKWSPDVPSEHLRREPSPLEQQVSEAISEALAERRTLTPLGGGTLRVVSGSAPAPLALRVADRILRYEPANFAITLEPGTTLAAVRRALKADRQRLVWEAPDPENATMGGILAAGYWASATQEFHHPKHSLLGFRAVTGDARPIEFGGRVVKNVSGYDVGKLLIGSRGTLAVFTQLTLRTYPLPERVAVAQACGEFLDLLDLASNLAVIPLGWTQIDLHAGRDGAKLLIGLDGHARDVERRWRELRASTGESLQLLEAEEASDLRTRAARGDAWRRSPLILRLVTSPGKCADLAARAQSLCAAGGEQAWTYRLQVHAGVGLLRIVFGPEYEDVPLRRLLLDLAEAVREIGGYRALDRAPGHPWWGWDAWGTPAQLRDRMRLIRTIFDPRGVFAGMADEPTAKGS